LRAAQETGIAWKYDKEHLYGNYLPTNFNSDPGYRGGNTSTLPVNQNEHLMVWLKPAAKPSFRKLWAIIHEPIPAGAAAPVPARPAPLLLAVTSMQAEGLLCACTRGPCGHTVPLAHLFARAYAALPERPGYVKSQHVIGREGQERRERGQRGQRRQRALGPVQRIGHSRQHQPHARQLPARAPLSPPLVTVVHDAARCRGLPVRARAGSVVTVAVKNRFNTYDFGGAKARPCPRCAAARLHGPCLPTPLRSPLPASPYDAWS